MRYLVVGLLVFLFVYGAAFAQEEKSPEASAAFQKRQADLISLSGHLGALHRLRQICHQGGAPDLYRNRMRELVPLESPMASTRQAMIDAFNENYRAMSAAHMTCGREAEATYRDEAESALLVTERLYRPFR